MFYNDPFFPIKQDKRLLTKGRLGRFFKMVLSFLIVSGVVWLGWHFYRYVFSTKAYPQHLADQVSPPTVRQYGILEAPKLGSLASTNSAHIVANKGAIAIFQLDNIGRDQLIYAVDRSGGLFETVPSTLSGLPILKGPSAEAVVPLLKHYERLSILLKAQSLAIAVLQVDQEDRYNLTLSNGIQLTFGQFDPAQQLQQLLHVNPALLHAPDKIAFLDLRYPRGVAITSCKASL